LQDIDKTILSSHIPICDRLKSPSDWNEEHPFMNVTARQAYNLRIMQPGVTLPPPFHAMTTADLRVEAEREEAAGREDTEQDISEAARPVPAAPEAIDPVDRALRRGPPRRSTPARLRTYFLRVFERTGSVAEAAARTGVTPRTVQRWRATNPVFARRYDETLARRVELLEDLALQRASGRAREPRFYHGRQVATVERHNDAMLMRVLARFDRAQERAQARRDFDAEVARRVEIEVTRERQRCDAVIDSIKADIARRVELGVERRISEMSLSGRQATPPIAPR